MRALLALRGERPAYGEVASTLRASDAFLATASSQSWAYSTEKFHSEEVNSSVAGARLRRRRRGPGRSLLGRRRRDGRAPSGLGAFPGARGDDHHTDRENQRRQGPEAHNKPFRPLFQNVLPVPRTPPAPPRPPLRSDAPRKTRD